jgi:phage portal protein BeeE
VGLVERWRKFVGADQERSGYPLSFGQWLEQLYYAGQTYLVGGGSIVEDVEKVGAGFDPYVTQGFKGNGVVFACEASRLTLFTEARFQWRELRDGRPGNLFGTPELRILEEPWPGGTTGDLLARMILDADLAGNSFTLRRLGRLTRLRPDWVSLVYDGDPWDPETVLRAYAYQIGGPQKGRDPTIFLPGEVAHFAPMPDPLSPRRGMSWLTPVLREIDADTVATSHKESLFRKGGTPNMIVKTDTTVTEELFEAVVKLYREGHEDTSNAGKAWFVQSGFDPTVVGSNLQQLDFKTVQGAGETRIAAASGIHPVIVGLSEGLQGASLNAGNFNSARRLTADKTLRPLWRNVSGSLEWLVSTPVVKAGKAELWYDERDIPFLHEDRKDAADMQVAQASAMKQLIDAGYEPDSVTDAINANDYMLLKHSGMVTVQVQPGTTEPTQNGKADALAPVG